MLNTKKWQEYFIGSAVVLGGLLISSLMLYEVSGSNRPTKLAISGGGGSCYGYGQSSYYSQGGYTAPGHEIGSGSFTTPNCYSYSYSQGYYYTYSQGSYGSINSFTGTSGSSSGTAVSINKGDSVTLSWSTSGFTSCTLVDNHGNTLVPPPGGVPSTNSSKVVTPTENTIYTLTCNPGSASGQVTVIIKEEPVFKEITPP